MFSSAVSRQWLPSDVTICPGGELTVVVDGSLSESRSVSLLRHDSGLTILSLSPARASELDLSDRERIDSAEVSGRIERAGVAFNDPDHLFYLSLSEQALLRDETSVGRTGATRELTADDAEAFAELTAEAPDDDLDGAYVELDHWLVLGTFVGDRLASVASMYPWDGTLLADLGVITLPRFRGRGLGRATVRAISAAASARGYEPQYRCQLDNSASVALARAAGFTHFGEWRVVDTAR